MKKTLIVNYTPRIDSNTKKLVDYFIQENKNKTEITFLDLAKNTPDLLLENNLNLSLKRNYGGVPLSDSETSVLAKNDEMTAQLLATDFIVFAFPMYNYSIPATVKAWIDGVVQAGITFQLGEAGYEGLCKGKQALVLMTTGSDFGEEPYKSMNFATPLMKLVLAFMGITSDYISAFGLQQYPDMAEGRIQLAQEEIKAFGNKWY